MESRRKSDSMTCACAVIRKHCGRQNGKVFSFCRHAWNREPALRLAKSPAHSRPFKRALWDDSTSAASWDCAASWDD